MSATVMKSFRSSPLWLIGLFVLFAEGISAIAAIQLDGWPRNALVIFVIAYATLVSLAFFVFLWAKPENFYAPSDYGGTTPAAFVDALRGKVPSQITMAAEDLAESPKSDDRLFELLANLIGEINLQHLILMHRKGDIYPANPDELDSYTHNYTIAYRNGSLAFGLFQPKKFLADLKGTDLVVYRSDKRQLQLLPEGARFAQWLIDKKRDAVAFKSNAGGWGDVDVNAFIKKLRKKHDVPEESTVEFAVDEDDPS